MASGADILRTAGREIGYHEQPGKRTKYGEWYGLQDEWCMMFVQWVYHEAGADLPFRTASCGALLRWYRDHQPECIVDDPVPGCVVIFDFPGGTETDHTGIFIGRTDTKITTIDGNTGSNSDASGGWVQQKTRDLDYANPTYIIPRELKEEEQVKRYDNMAEIRAAAPWAVPTVEKLIQCGALTGTTGWYDEDGNPTSLDLSEDMLRVLVISDRASSAEKKGE